MQDSSHGSPLYQLLPTTQPTTTAPHNLQMLHARIGLQPVDISAEFICHKKGIESSFMSPPRV